MKRVDKLFTETPKIYAGWLDLEISNDITIPVSYLNSRFFYDLLTIVLVLDSYGSITVKPLQLEIDCEGTMAYIKVYMIDCNTVKVLVAKEWYNFKTEQEGTDVFRYEIDRKNLVNNIFNLIENNIEKYNKDFCCGDVADYINREYVSTLKNSLCLF